VTWLYHCNCFFSMMSLMSGFPFTSIISFICSLCNHIWLSEYSYDRLTSYPFIVTPIIHNRMECLLLQMQVSPSASHSLSLRSKYPPEHHVLKHTSSTGHHIKVYCCMTKRLVCTLITVRRWEDIQ
jgi:hypothetical protein